MDDLDWAQNMEQRERDAGVERVRAIPRDIIPVDDLCIDCGFEIRPARRQACPETIRCVDCQQEHEGSRA